MTTHKFRDAGDMPADFWRWPHISPLEVACKGTQQLVVDTETLDCFERFRAERGSTPIRILSGYRSPSYNKAVGGAEASYHLLGRALDVEQAPLKGTIDIARFVAAATRAGFKGIGFYPHRGFCHLDTGPVRYWHGDE